jgi:protein SCO1/2
MRWRAFIVVCAAAAAACSRAPEPRRFEVHGQILGLDTARREVLVDHEDIKGFMPAMTMRYRVRDASLLEGRQVGDLVTATLVVEDVDSYLTSLTTTGRAPVREEAASTAAAILNLLDPGDVVPDYALVDQAGSPRPLGSLRGHRVALTFMYTRCPLPDFCPLMDKQFAALQQTIRQSRGLSDVRLVSVTLDPDFDTPAVLQRHAAALGADPALWSFVTGTRDDVLAFAGRFGAVVEQEDSSATLVHNLRTAVIDAEGRLVSAHSGNMWTPAELLADLEKASSSPR